MKPAKVIFSVVLGIIAVVLAWKVIAFVLGFLYSAISAIVALAIGVAVIGGLGWVILRLLGKKPLSGSKRQSLP